MSGSAGPASGETEVRQSLAHRVRRARRRGFVGRADQLDLFGRALGADPDAPRVLLVHGAGGIGKSALLRRFADDAQSCGRTVVLVDGQTVLASTDAFEREAAKVRTADRAVLLVDAFEQCQVLESWLREEFLPTLPEDVVVAVAGRLRPEPQWTVDAGWRDLARVEHLEDLPAADADALLDERGIPPRCRASLTTFAGGHPLALSLAAEAVDTEGLGDEPWEPSRDVVETLLKLLVDQVPSAAAEYALQVCGHVRHTTVDLLRTGLDEEQAIAAFDWLRALPYVTTGPQGLLPHDLVRDVIDSDFAWRDPSGYVQLHERLWRHLAARTESASGDALPATVWELLYLNRYSTHPVREMFTGGQREALFERPYGPELHDAVVALAVEHEGPELARLVEYWLDRRPEDFHVYCRSEDREPVSFLGWLRIRRPSAAEAQADPALAAVAQHMSGTARLGAEDVVGVGRFAVPRPSPDHYTVGADLHTLRISVEALQQGRTETATYLVLPQAESFEPAMNLFGYQPTGSLVGPDGLGLFVHDWREVPLSAHLQRCLPPIGSAAPAASADVTSAALSRDDHDAAVKQALRDWHEEVALAANPLGSGDPDRVRSILRDAVAALGEDPRRVKHHRAVLATFLERPTTQEATAARLAVPFSTYRRHLRRGVEEVCGHAWTNRPLSEVA
ncbi:hypothetical protein ACHAAC_09240 [Aeromicrobium sp. CF4.19]|uniref:hypothetical protein n=1 Tax=Aeromicrobium sp. CF4.19 TaxID=3373082 RepID=UPI003EE59F73